MEKQTVNHARATIVWMSVFALAFGLFWHVWNLIVGEIPVIREIIMRTGVKPTDPPRWTIILPFTLSHSWDMLVAPFFILAFSILPQKVKGDKKIDPSFGLVFGLFFGLSFGLIFGMGIGMWMGMGFGLVLAMFFSLGAGLVFGLSYGLGFGFMIGLVWTMPVGIAVTALIVAPLHLIYRLIYLVRASTCWLKQAELGQWFVSKNGDR